MEKNNAQEEIIHTVNGQLLVVACPGSGKTTTLLRRIHYMINEAKIPAQQILMVTFSSAAAKEMKTRYQKKFGMDAVTFSTIHSMCMSILKKFGGYTKESILSDPREYFYKVLRKQKGINDINEFITGLITEISVINNNSIDLNSYKPKCTRDKKLFLKLINGYQEYKEELHLIDFDDMLQKAYEIMVNDKECLDFLRNKYRYIQVDEYQDTNLIQKDIIYLLAGQDGNLAVVGDDDQSIYAFRGAKPEIMLNFQKEYPKSKMVKMSTNYRSGKKIISEADRVIKSNTNRFQKDFIGFKPENGAVEYIVTEEKKDEILKIFSRIKKLLNDGENPADIAVLFRTNRQAEKMAAILFRNQIPFQSNEKIQSKYEHWMFQDLQAYYSKPDDSKTDDTKKDDSSKDDGKKEDSKTDDTSKDDSKKDDFSKEDTSKGDVKKDDSNLTDKKKDSTVTEKNTNQKDAQTSEKKDDQNSSDSGSGSNSVKTGDPAVWGLWASLFGSSGIAGAVIRRRKRK